MMMIITIIFSRPQQYKMAKYCDEIFGELLLKVETVESTFYRNILSPEILWCIHFITQDTLSQEKKKKFGRNLNIKSLFLNKITRNLRTRVFQEPLPDFPLEPGTTLPPPSR